MSTAISGSGNHFKPRQAGASPLAVAYVFAWLLLGSGALLFLMLVAAGPGVQTSWSVVPPARDVPDPEADRQMTAALSAEVERLRSELASARRIAEDKARAMLAPTAGDPALAGIGNRGEQRVLPQAAPAAPPATVAPAVPAAPAAPLAAAAPPPEPAQARAQVAAATRLPPPPVPSPARSPVPEPLAAVSGPASTAAAGSPPGSGISLLNAPVSPIQTGSLPAPAADRIAPAPVEPAPAPTVNRSTERPARKPIVFGPALVTPAAPATTASVAATAGVTIAQGQTLDALRLSWSLMRERHGDVLGQLEARYRAIGHGGSAPYELIAGPVEPVEAMRHCETLRASGVSCSIALFTGNAL